MRSTASRSSRTSSARARACCTRSCFPSQFGCTDEGAPRYKYDPALAKKLLAEAGYPNGFDTDIVAYRERNQTEAMINNLQAVGIRAKLTFSAVRGDARSDPRQQGGTDPPDLGLVLGQRRVGLDTGLLRRSNPTTSRATRRCGTCCRRGTTRSIPAVRKKAYQQALKMIADNAYSVPLWSLPVYYVATKELNFTAYPDETGPVLGDDLEVIAAV